MSQGPPLPTELQPVLGPLLLYVCAAVADVQHCANMFSKLVPPSSSANTLLPSDIAFS